MLLWRHAEAEDAAAGQADAKRHLTGRGQKQAGYVADWLRKRQPKRLRILVSPAERCQQTARALALPFDIEAKIGVSADPEHLLAAAGWPDGDGKSGGAVLLIGHQPTLGRLAARLLSGRGEDWNIKKGALWWFTTRGKEGDTQTDLKAVVNPDLM